MIQLEHLTKEYNGVRAVNDLTTEIPDGEIFGLLGPNGAGKSTTILMLTGLIEPTSGRCLIGGLDVARDPIRVKQQIGYMPEDVGFYASLSAEENLTYFGRLYGMDTPACKERSAELLSLVGLEGVTKDVGGYSKGMRQRTKLAQALVHEPRMLFLDEPFTGTDPLARRDLIDAIRGLEGTGRSVLVSSHILHEVEALTPNVVLLHRGRLVAEGHVRQIRDLIDAHPHRIVLVCDDCRALAAKLVRWEDVEGLTMLRAQKGLLVETRRPDAFYARLPAISMEDGTALREVYSDDDNLEAVFKYLVSK